MQTFSIRSPNCGFILSEANGHRSRENGVLLAGQGVILAGQVVMDNGAGKLVKYLGEDVTAGGTNEAVGIVMYESDTTDADVPVAYIARDAEVIQSCLTYQEDTTGNLATAHMVASLALNNIIVRD